jgi:hypothetical protein
MIRNRILIILATAATFGCSESAVPPTAESDGPALLASVGGKVVHQATAGTPDICTPVGDKPGCDANFSLTALQNAGGRVTGQWVDRASQVNGGGGVHVAVNCLNVIGNRAYVSGVVTQSGNSDQIGQQALTKVVDNGRSANDPPDQISITIIFPGVVDCNGAPAFDDVIPLFATPQGQVVVR